MSNDKLDATRHDGRTAAGKKQLQAERDENRRRLEETARYLLVGANDQQLREWGREKFGILWRRGKILSTRSDERGLQGLSGMVVVVPVDVDGRPFTTQIGRLDLDAVQQANMMNDIAGSRDQIVSMEGLMTAMLTGLAQWTHRALDVERGRR